MGTFSLTLEISLRRNVPQCSTYSNVKLTFSHRPTLSSGKSHGWFNTFVRTWPPNDGWRNDGTVDEALQDRAWTNLYIPYVKHCQSRGVYVVFCGNAPDGGQFMGAQHKTNMIRYWTRIFNRYPEIRDAENVMIEICNEPVVIRNPIRQRGLAI